MKCTPNVGQKLTFGGVFFMSKYSYEERLETVLRIVEDGMSPKQSANILGTSHEHVRRWLMRYQKFGIAGLMLKNRSYDGDFKLSVVEYMHANNLSIRQAAVEFALPNNGTLGKWERIYYQEGPQGLYKENRGRKSKMSSKRLKKKRLDKQVEKDLIAEVQRLRMENDYLKKLQALVQERISRENGNKPK